jgi:hypothetical protein
MASNTTPNFYVLVCQETSCQNLITNDPSKSKETCAICNKQIIPDGKKTLPENYASIAKAEG